MNDIFLRTRMILGDEAMGRLRRSHVAVFGLGGVGSYAAPEPSPEPGYTDEVVMASGSFTQGSTIELSCDGPLRAPYTCYLQGGLNFAASRAGVLLAVQKAYFKE